MRVYALGMKKTMISVVVMALVCGAVGSEVKTDGLVKRIEECYRNANEAEKAIFDWKMRCVVFKNGKIVEFKKEEAGAAGSFLEVAEGCRGACDNIRMAVKLVDLVTEADKKEEALLLLGAMLRSEYFAVSTLAVYLNERRDIPAAGYFLKMANSSLVDTKAVIQQVVDLYGLKVELKEPEL